MYGRFACSNNNTVTINATLNGQFLGTTQLTNPTQGNKFKSKFSKI